MSITAILFPLQCPCVWGEAALCHLQLCGYGYRCQLHGRITERLCDIFVKFTCICKIHHESDEDCMYMFEISINVFML